LTEPVTATRPNGSQAPAEVADVVSIEVPVGGRVLVVSDLHLTADVSVSSVQATTEIAQAIDAWTGPGVLIFNGGTLELLALAPGRAPAEHQGPSCRMPDCRAILAAHPRLAASIQAFASGCGRRVLYLPGARDGRAVWDAGVSSVLHKEWGTDLALAAELRVETGTGPRTVRVEPGHNLDPLTRPTDPRNPADSPLGQHLVCEVLPALRAGSPSGRSVDGGWLSGLESLDNPAAFPRFLASRLAYRRIGRHAWWLTLPVLAALIVRLPLAALHGADHRVASASRIAAYVGVATLVDLILVAVVAAIVVRRTWHGLAGVALAQDDGGADLNGAARARARELVTAGCGGLITSHTRRAELTHLGCGFYANSGCASEVVSEAPSRLSKLGMPSLFLTARQLSWIELEAGNDLHARLLFARQDLAGASLIERFLVRPTRSVRGGRQLQPSVVASFPRGESWPPAPKVTAHQRRIRRWAAGLVALAGLISLASAFSGPVRARLHAVMDVFPLAVPQVANSIVALGGLGLLLLARGIRRGQRSAWLICEGLLALTAVLHLVKGFDVEEALIATGVAGYLLFNREAFAATGDRPSAKRGIVMLAGGAVAAIAAGTFGAEVGTMLSRSRHHRRLPLPRAVVASAERLLGLQSVQLPHRLDDFFAPAMLTVGAGLVAAAAYLFFRPVVARRRSAGADTGLERAREIVKKHGSGTLDYFALRSDKQFFFWGDTVIAYGVYGGVCLVSPDPIGPVAERDEAWRAFRRFADDQGWTLAVLGAGEEWLPVYRESGMHDLYVGDEAVVDCGRFTLEGGRYKGLRQAVNRMAKYGYRVSFHDPAHLDPALRSQLESVMTKSRRGDVERGFSMTLGRAFDPADAGLLLAVVHGPADGSPDGQPGPVVAFIQYVPAPGIDGYSLDLMRRDDGDHPNGLMDFAIVETIKQLPALGRYGLGLNFATMRAVLAGEAGEGLSQRIQAWMLRRMSGSMQIESLWRFNAKYDPRWQPRYAIYDSTEHALPAAMAIARAESFWELPVIGRLLVPGSDRTEPTPEPAASTTA
jgi:lysylphosphatidylglycerol synthetase-like protein (DUF2156 family)